MTYFIVDYVQCHEKCGNDTWCEVWCGDVFETETEYAVQLFSLDQHVAFAA